ncbi:MAG: hypothetical protein AAGA50_19660 [Pseudomonadota bacterium]
MNRSWRKHLSRYVIRMCLVFAAYTGMLFAANFLDGRLDLQPWQRIAISLLPVLPAIVMIFIILDYVRAMDEVWQKIVTESMLISACIVGIGTFSLGFMEGVVSLPSGILIWIWPAMIAIQGVTMWIVRLRYS